VAAGARAQLIAVAEALLGERARQAIERCGGVWRQQMLGLAWFDDPETGATLAMHLREAIHDELVREHMRTSRAEFEKGKQ
jgi:hypothetical protein